MAKGNDGNLMQHGIELAAVSAIASKPLWLTCTHSMAPRESCPEPNRDRRLRHWLNTQFGTPSVAAAYRLTNATLDSYPNTSELIAATFGDENIRGDLFEVCEDKICDLHARWSQSELRVHGLSWRQGLSRIQIPPPDSGWLFTMDPMTFVCNTEDVVDDNKLRRTDVDRLIGFFHTIPGFGSSWVITIFCFELRRGPGTNCYQLFLDEMQRMSRAMTLQLATLEVSYGNPHVAAVFSASGDKIDRIRWEWETLHGV
jgi:hypothetical protein